MDFPTLSPQNIRNETEGGDQSGKVETSRNLFQQGLERVTPFFTSKYLEMVSTVEYSDYMLPQKPLDELLGSINYDELSRGDRRALKWLSNLTPADIQIIRDEVTYLNVNLPRLESSSDIYPAVMATVLIFGNMALSNTVRVTSTALIADLAYREEDPILKGIYSTVFGYITLTNVAVPIPSLPGFSNYFSFNVLEVPFVNAFRKWYWKHTGNDQKSEAQIVSKKLKNMFSPSKLTLNIEFVGSAMLLVLEFLRAYNLDEVSPTTILFLNNFKRLRKYIKNENDSF